MGKIFKFSKINDKLSNYERVIIKKVTSFIIHMNSSEGADSKDEKFKLLNRHFRIGFELRKSTINLKILRILKCDIGSCFEKMDKIFSEQNNIFYNSPRTSLDYLEKCAMMKLKEDEIKEKQIQSLVTVSRNFLYYDGSNLFFCGGNFGSHMLASVVLDYLGITQKIKDRFYVEAESENLLARPDNTPKTELNQAELNFNK